MCYCFDNTLAAAASPNETIAATAPLPALPAKRCDFVNAWGSFMIPSTHHSDTFWYYNEETNSDDEDKDLTWDEAFSTYEFSILCSGDDMSIEKKRKANKDDNEIPLSSLQIIKCQRKDDTLV